MARFIPTASQQPLLVSSLQPTRQGNPPSPLRLSGASKLTIVARPADIPSTITRPWLALTTRPLFISMPPRTWDSGLTSASFQLEATDIMI
ncbi:hypothetical protein BDV06DRAFT_65723 [Aspergillus oleicola]